MMSITSDMPALEAELADVAPWLVGRGIGKADLTARQGSAIWEMKGQDIPPTLIMQGEKDERVPLTQAVLSGEAVSIGGCRLRWPCIREKDI